jgi:SAM-dependent methyltransferase
MRKSIMPLWQSEIKNSLCEFYNYSSEEYDTKIKLVGKLYPKIKDWIDSGRKDFSLYNEKDYLFETVEAFNYSSEAIKRTFSIIKKLGKLDDIKSILDYGCGLGMTSMLFSDLFPNTTIYAYDISTAELDFLKYVKEKYNYKNIIIINDISQLPEKPTLVACFEVIEHNKDLDMFMEHIFDLIIKYFVFTSRFDSDYLGHFDKYNINSITVEPKKAKHLLYKKLKSELIYLDSGWNGWPSVYERVQND